MAWWAAHKSWLLIMVLQIDLENSATGIIGKNTSSMMKEITICGLLTSVPIYCRIFLKTLQN